MKCAFRGCKKPARWQARKLWGKGGTLCTCDAHKPCANRPASMQHLPSFYEVKPLVAKKEL